MIEGSQRVPFVQKQVEWDRLWAKSVKRSVSTFI